MSYTPRRRKEDRYPGRVATFFIRFFVVMGVAATISAGLLFMTLMQVVNYSPAPPPDRIVLTYTFKTGVTETVGKPSLSQPLLRPATTLYEITRALYSAAKDERVKGFVANIEDPDFSLAQVQELRDAVHAFRKAGKFAWVYSNSFGSYTPGMGAYYLASAFDKIWVQPVGAVAVNGIAIEVPFFKEVLDKLGIAADFSHQGTYKTTPESLTRTGMSAPHREMMSSLIGDLSAQMIAGIAADRGMTPQDIRAKINRAPFIDTAAVEEKLIDHIGYYDEMRQKAKEAAEVTDTGLISLTGYNFFTDSALKYGMIGFVTNLTRHTSPPGAYRNHAKIALIYGAGDIVPFKSQAHAGFGGSSMAADRVVAAFDKALEDKDVAAVVFRVDSPGGSPEAAESIRRAIIRTQKKGRPVIVSMSGYAASGGYWIAAPADKIVAQPATLTGSIGVFGGKINSSGLWQKIGINWESAAEGDTALMWSGNRSFTPIERQRFEKMLGNIYDAFITRVAEGRGMTREAVEKVAEGRVWTGRQAMAQGLVDVLGGMEEAVVLAKQTAGIDPAQYVPVLQYPPRKTGLELFLGLAVGEGAETSVLPQISAGDVVQAVADTMLEPTANTLLRLPDFSVR